MNQIFNAVKAHLEDGSIHNASTPPVIHEMGDISAIYRLMADHFGDEDAHNPTSLIIPSPENPESLLNIWNVFILHINDTEAHNAESSTRTGTITVYEEDGVTPLNDAAIWDAINNSVIGQTNIDGIAVIDITTDEFLINITRNGFVSQNLIVIAAGDVDFSESYNLVAEPVTRTGTIVVYQEDGMTPIQGAMITDNSGTWQEITNDQGFATIVINFEETVLNIEADGYVTQNPTIAAGVIDFAESYNLVAQPTSRTGTITVYEEDGVTPLPGVLVSDANSGTPMAETDINGVLIIELPFYNIMIRLTKEGFVTKDETIGIGLEDFAVSYNMAQILTRTGTITVYDNDGVTPIEGVDIIDSASFDTLGTTDMDGIAIIAFSHDAHNIDIVIVGYISQTNILIAAGEIDFAVSYNMLQQEPLSNVTDINPIGQNAHIVIDNELATITVDLANIAPNTLQQFIDNIGEFVESSDGSAQQYTDLGDNVVRVTAADGLATKNYGVFELV